MNDIVKARPQSMGFNDPFVIVGLFLISLQFFQIGPAQSGQLWVLGTLALVVLRGGLAPRLQEVLCYVLFMATALVLTFFADYDRVKAVEQVIKFAIVYPACYLVGRSLGSHYQSRNIPFGFTSLWLFLVFQFLVQHFEVPVLHQHVPFMQGALHGTFKERNWLAVFFFLGAYLLFLRSDRKPKSAALFASVCIAVALLSGSKTILIPCGVVLLLQFKGGGVLKWLAVAAGAGLFYYRFGPELSGELLRVRLEEERGLALIQVIELIERNFVGYGFGFVESYFSTFWIAVRGLGAGTNSVFSSPLDLFVIAGIPGVLMWMMFFAGVGLGWTAVTVLAPVALWSLVNPLHQSEIVYLFCGWLVSYALAQQASTLQAASGTSTVGHERSVKGDRLLNGRSLEARHG